SAISLEISIYFFPLLTTTFPLIKFQFGDTHIASSSDQSCSNRVAVSSELFNGTSTSLPMCLTVIVFNAAPPKVENLAAYDDYAQVLEYLVSYYSLINTYL